MAGSDDVARKQSRLDQIANYIDELFPTGLIIAASFRLRTENARELKGYAKELRSMSQQEEHRLFNQLVDVLENLTSDALNIAYHERRLIDKHLAQARTLLAQVARHRGP
jgi:hypothetical protein